MSAPADRLVGDAAAQRFEVEAFAVMACHPFIPPATEALAAATLLLVRDREARLEMACAGVWEP